MEQDDLCEIVGCTKLATHKRYKKLWTDVVDNEKRYEATIDELYTTIRQYCKDHYNTDWTDEGLISKSIKQLNKSMEQPTNDCPHEDNITYQKLIEIDGCPQYEVKCENCGKLGVIYLVEGEEDWECRNQINN